MPSYLFQGREIRPSDCMFWKHPKDEVLIVFRSIQKFRTIDLPLQIPSTKSLTLNNKARCRLGGGTKQD